MNEKNYKKELEELNEKYDLLNMKFVTINNELYYLKCSRLYKFSLMLGKILNPLRLAARRFSTKNINASKIKEFLSKTEKLVIIPSSFKFDEFVNQRPINYAKFLADNGYKILFIVWQWDKDSKIKNAFEEVYTNVFQVPLYDFLNIPIDYDKINSKSFYINFPNELFVDVLYDLRYKGFFIHYDIMDEWEEFKKVGQAIWYNKSIEEKIILESDYVTAVSPYLIEKFSYLRTDINLSPNGFYKKITGESNRNISLKEVVNKKVNIGYFGHLTDSWFDWELLFKIANENKNYIIHIIGYDISDENLEKINKQENINYYGKIPTNLLYKYVQKWNIGIILFKESNLAKAVDPIKIYEYLYMGLPVIVSGIEHLSTYPNTVVIKNAKEFSKCVLKIINNKLEDNVEEFLKNSSWEVRFSKFLDNYSKKGMNRFYEK